MKKHFSKYTRSLCILSSLCSGKPTIGESGSSCENIHAVCESELDPDFPILGLPLYKLLAQNAQTACIFSQVKIIFLECAVGLWLECGVGLWNGMWGRSVVSTSTYQYNYSGFDSCWHSTPFSLSPFYPPAYCDTGCNPPTVIEDDFPFN